MARIQGFTGAPSQELIDRNIADKEQKMIKNLLKAARWNKSGSVIDDWLIKADVQSLEIHTLETKCEDKDYEFIDESLEEGCGGGIGIGSMRITGTANKQNCPVFRVRGIESNEKVQGEFSYCEFVTVEFTRGIGIPDPCGDGCRRLPYRTRFKLKACAPVPIQVSLPFNLGFDLIGTEIPPSEGNLPFNLGFDLIGQ